VRSLIVVLGIIAVFVLPVGAADETGRYFEELRRRGLYAVAEHYALSRLGDSQLPAALRAEFTVELSATFAAHASAVSPQQRDELWNKAGDILDEALKQPNLPRMESLRAQRGLVAARRAEILFGDAQVASQDTVLVNQARAALTTTVELLAEQIGRLDASLKAGGKRNVADLAPHELRSLRDGLQLELGDAERRRAQLFAAGSPDRASALVEAQSAYRDALSGATDARRIAKAKLGIADVTRLQRDFARAREMCAAIAAAQPPLEADLLHAVEACRMRCLLDEGQPVAAAEAFLALRRTEPVLSGELWLVQMQTLLALRATAEEKQNADLAMQLDAELDLILQRVDEQVGGVWSLWCRRLRAGDRTRRQYGDSLDRLVTRARSDYQAGRLDSAAPLLAEAFDVARRQDQRELAVELGTLHGSVLLEQQQFESAATALAAVVALAPEHPRAAATDLLGAYALGRAYEQQRTQPRRLAYTAALERHLDRFHTGDTVGDALFMLAQLQEQRLQYSQALPLYLRIPADHARYHAGTLGAARCQLQLVLRLKALKQAWTAFHAQAVAELEQRMQPWPPESWTPDQGAIAIELARLQLWGEPPASRKAADLLERIDIAAAAVADNAETWRALKQQAIPLKLVAWAGTGRSLQARQLLSASQLQTPANLLTVVLGLDQLAAGNPDGQFVDLTELLIDAVQRLEPFRDQLPAASQVRFDLARVRTYLVTGRSEAALAIVPTFPKEAAVQREVATLLMASRDPAALRAARAAWQRIESQSPAGSPEWLSARLETIDAVIQLGDRAEAAKLLKLTRLLYPDIPSMELQQRLMELDQKMTP
jgi:hypothetical protein